MVHHIVMWKFKAGVNKEDAFRELKSVLEGLVSVIDGLSTMQVGLNHNPGEAAWDFALQSTHPDESGLAEYQAHPEHVKVAKRVNELTADRAVVDYSR